MGNKKKTKWRKVPSAELSQITLKNSSYDQSRSEDKYCSDEIFGESGKSIENNTSECCDLRQKEFPNPNQLRCYDQYEESRGLNGETNVTNADGISGIYVNGLWIPVSNLKKNCTTFNNTTLGLNSALQVPPYFRPSSFCPSTCPRFQTVHAPDVPLHPNYFVPSDNHYLYYFIRGQPNCSTNYFGGDHIDRMNGEECSDDYYRSYDGYYTDQRDSAPTKILKNCSASVKRIDQGKNEYVKNCASNQHQDCSIEEQGNSRTVHPYPGYTFGHPLYSIPLVTFTPNANTHAQTTSWPLGPIQRKRRRRRKGYAEYAVIPPKKNNPELKSNNGITARRKESNSLKLSKKNFTEKIVHDSSDYVEKNSLSTFSQDNIDENIPPYASTVSERILLKTREELKNIFFPESSNISSIETSNEYHSKIITTDEVLQDICKNVLNTIVSEISDKATFPSENTSLEVTKPMLSMHPSKSSEIEVTYVEDTVTKQPHDENISVRNNIVNGTREECESDKLNENILENSQLSSFSEDNNVESENYKDEDFTEIKSGCLAEHSKNISEIMPMSTVDDNENIAVSADKFQGENFMDTQCFPVTRQPRTTHAFQDIIHIGCQESESDESNFISGIASKQKTNDAVLVDRNDSNENYLNHHSEANDNAKQIIHPQNRSTSSIGSKGSYKNEDREELMAKVHNICKEAEISHDVSHFCQSPFMPHTMSSEVLIRETELELSKIQQLTSSSTATQSIYKLSYDDCVTDQSENEDTDEKIQLESNHTCSDTCRPIENDTQFSEILVHEADSTSEAGSEDVELLPHRYQSESVQDCNKHIYVNNLSLAVEMLRTRENLPYDDEFKRIVDEDNAKSNRRADRSRIRAVNTQKTFGMENPAYVEELSSNSIVKNNLVQENVPKIHSYRSSSKGLRHSDCRTSVSDSGVQSGDSGDEMAEEADEISCKPDENMNKSQQWQSDQTANYRRFGQQMRQQFSVYTPRASIMKPCLCCIVM